MIILPITEFIKPAASGWVKVGNTLAITGMVGPVERLTNLTSTRIATIGDGNPDDELRAYDFDGSDFSLVGSAIATGLDAGDLGGITALSSTRVVINGYFSGNSGYKVYDFDGSNWSLYDSDLNWFKGDIDALSSTRIVQIDLEGSDLIESYDFLDPGWDLDTDGNLNEGGGICALTATRAVVTEGGVVDVMRVFDRGAFWTQTGNNQSIAGSSGFPPVAKLTSTRVVFAFDDQLRIYEFDGSDFSVLPETIDTGTFIRDYTRLTDTRIALINNTGLECYDYIE